MVSILRPFAVIAQAIKAFFRADVRVRRGERGLRWCSTRRSRSGTAPAGVVRRSLGPPH